MEPENRPYVDSETEPGDAGTGDWADTPPGADRPGKGSLANPPGAADPNGIVDGSLAGEFVNDPDSVDSRSRDRG